MVSIKTKVFGIINILFNLVSLLLHVLLLIFAGFAAGYTSFLEKVITDEMGIIGLFIYGIVIVIVIYAIFAVIFLMIYLYLHIKAYSRFSENKISKVFMFTNLILLTIYLRRLGFNYLSSAYSGMSANGISFIALLAIFVYFINPVIGIIYSSFGILDAYKLERMKKIIVEN
ncbi:MAG: hypothetical protein WC006_05795 [Bacilli bacterium]